MTKKPSKYSEKFKDPRWQKKRLEILERDGFTCVSCCDTKKTLHVHHCYYERGKDPWDYPSASLITLCAECHEEEGTDRSQEEAVLVSLLARNGWTRQQLDMLAHTLDGCWPQNKDEVLLVLSEIGTNNSAWLSVLGVLAQYDYMLHTIACRTLGYKYNALFAKMKEDREKAAELKETTAK